MKHILTLLLALSSCNVLFAQNSQPRILCGNEVFSTMVREKYPALQAAFDQTFEQARQKGAVTERSPLTIKVVVHVVWNTPAENLADSVVENQIQVLNEDFNHLNADAANLRPLFQPVAGAADIHFQLAEIVRVQTSQLFALDLFGTSILPELKHDSQGGSDAWDTEKYLNLWVCKIQPTTIFGIPVGQILGFAFPPNGLGNWPADSGAPNPDEDGVVIDYRMIGRNNPNPIDNPATGGTLLVAGRTPTHEIGHYLGLRHIWGDGGLLGPNDCAQSDGVDDTPYASAQSDFDCNLTKNSCEQVEIFYNDDVPDLVENFMDYSSEACMNMFSKGQVELMINVLTGPRSGLLENTSANAASTQNLNWSVLPNPSEGVFFLDIQSEKSQDVAVNIFNLEGKMILEQTERSLTSGRQRLSFDGSNWAAGMYFVALKTASGSSVRKVVLRAL
ncbi:MAG: T9SS type A sorting domain-containing protein [Phycisphaerae bacterium]|nr:T9SS type A sorting domain-containing protein [Saprospiraceae bacterium]